jgi:Tfp pilus assembly protein PilP
MNLTTGIVALALTAGTAWAQNPTIIQNTKTALQGAQQQKTAASNAALQGTTPAKPSGAVPAKAGAAIPAKPAPPAAAVPAKTTLPAAAAQATPAKPAVKVLPVKTAQAPDKTQTPAKTQATSKPQTAAAPKTAQPPEKPAVKIAAKPAAKTAVSAAKATVVAGGEAEASKSEKPEDKKYSMTGKRDPFVSPVVNRQGGSGCSTGKKCLDIEQIALHGVVKSDNGMIAVVTNSLNKAYFLRENDPVFNGYVVKITVDSIVFKETFQDRLGKPFTKDVVKRILTPAV